MEENKKKSRYSEAQNRATQKYQKRHLDQLAIRVPKGMKQVYKDHAEKVGMPLSQFIVAAIEEKMKRDNTEK